jgi:GT2 family glycosyltransferase
MSISVSVVVVSRDRPDALHRCVLGLSQLQYDKFEIVVVADAKGLAGLDQFADQIKKIPFDEPNISAARNIGISNAAGKVIAFIDDDAVPEPTWLSYLTAPFVKEEVAAVGGFVLGRNGISFQWKARVLDGNGSASDISVDEKHPTVLRPPAGHAVKTEGTNMAVRRETLVALGGFDPAYHFYLDETDLNMRLAAAGYTTAIAPLAQVHHGFAKSLRRCTDRVPTDLFDIGASWAVFQRKFLPENGWGKHWIGVRKSERKRVITHMISGGLEPSEVRKLLQRLDEGYEKGQLREIEVAKLPASSLMAFLAFPTAKRRSVFLTSRLSTFGKKRNDARNLVKESKIVTLLVLSPTALFHRVQFTADGYWEQIGGLFGKSVRSQKVFKLWFWNSRSVFESERIKLTRIANL